MMSKPNSRSGFEYDLRHLEMFLDTVQTGSMTETALRFGVTQPAVSHIIATLEKAVGSPIYDRSIRPIQLTPAGRVLLTNAQRLIAAAYEMARDVRRAGRDNYAELRIGVVDSVIGLIAADLVQYLDPLAQSLSIWAGLSPDQRNALLDRRADLVISSDAMEETDDVERYEVLREPFIVVLPRSLTHLQGAPLHVLAEEAPLIRYSSHSHIGQQIEQHLRRLRVKLPRVFELDVSDALFDCVRAGAGWSISTPVCFLSASKPIEDFVFAPLDPGRFRSIYLVFRRGELGNLPRDIATLAARAIRKNGLDRLASLHPWLGQKLEIAS